MKTLYLGDVVGRTARNTVGQRLPKLIKKLELDFVVVNGENAAGGFGITSEICDQLFEAGADVIVTGNHVWDQKEILPVFEREPRLLRPQNFPASAPGSGIGRYKVKGGRTAVVVQVMGRVFMDPLDDPFACVDTALADIELGRDAQFVMVDIHGEATSEKMAMGHHLDGRVSLVAGTHTHVPTADAHVMNGGTAYISDVGMCGDYASVIGMDKAEPLQRFTRKIATGRFTAALGETTICGVYVESDDRTGRATYVASLREGGQLAASWPR